MDDVEDKADAAQGTANSALSQASRVEQSLDSFKTSVSRDYQTKTDALSQKSELEQNINSFKTTVSETYTTKDEFNDLSISGANLVKNSRELSSRYNSGRWSIDSSGEFSYANSTDSTGGSWSEVWIPLYAEYNSITGQCMVSFEGKNLNSLFGVSLAAFNSSNGRVEETKNLMLNDSRFSSSVLDDGWTRYVAYFTASEVSSINKLSSATQYAIQFKRSPSTSTTNFQFRKPKVELGTKATAWSPAPEDFDGKYASKTEFKQTTDKISVTATAASQNASSALSKISSLEVSVDGIDTRVEEVASDADEAVKTASQVSQRVDSLSSTITQVSGRVDDVEDKADAATSTANSALSKSSSVEQNLNSFKTNVSQTYETKSDASSKQSSLQQSVNNLRTEVSQTYTTKTEFNNLQVGGTNLLRLGAYGFHSAVTGTSYDKANDLYKFTVPANATTNNSWGVGLNTHKGKSYVSGGVPWQKYGILSFYIYVDHACSINIDVNTQAWTGSVGGTGNDHDTNRSHSSFSIPANQWTQVWQRWQNAKTSSSTGNPNKVDLYDCSTIGVLSTSSAINVQIKKLKFEVGTKPTDWSPCPADMLSSDQAAQTYSTKSYVDQTARTVSLGVVEEYKSGKHGSALATASDITAAKDSITSTVSQTYTTKTEFNNLQVGGTNIARDTQAFGHNGVSSTEEGYLRAYVNRTNGTYKGLTVRNIISSDGTGVAVCEYLVTNVKHSEYYTLSFWAKGSGKIRTYFYGPSGYITAKAVSASNGSGNTSFSDGGWNMTLSSSWQRYFVVYQTAASGGTSTDKYMLLRNDNDMASCDVCGVMIERGNKASDWSASPLDVSATYATKTEVKQTTDSLTVTISSAVSKAESAAEAAADAQTTANSAKKQRYNTVNASSGTTGYFRFATLKITQSHTNRPIYFSLSNRGQKASNVWVQFNNVNSTDPSLNYIQADGGMNVWIHKTATSTWEMIARKSEAYDSLTVDDYSNANSITVTWVNGFLSSVPSGSTQATRLASKRPSSDIDNAQSTANTANTNAQNAQNRVGNLETCIKMTSDGVRVGKISNGNFTGYSALVNSEGSFDILDSSSKTLAFFDKDGLNIKSSSDRGMFVGFDSAANSGYIGSTPKVATSEGGRTMDIGMNMEFASGGYLNIINNLGGAGITAKGISLVSAGGNPISMYWGGQGLGGLVMQLLWSGSCSHGGTISSSLIPYYNIFSFETNGGRRGLCVRNSSGALHGVAANDDGSAWVQNFSANISGSTISGVNCRTTPLNNGGNQQWQNITRLYGVL